jgi:predicted peptidase
MKLTSTFLLASSLLLGAGSASAQTAGQQAPQAFSKESRKTLKAQYLLYLPKEYGKDPGKKWPLILFLHGAGESGSDLEKVKVHGPPRLITEGKELPFIVVSPQCPEGNARQPGSWWDPATLNALLDEVIAHHQVDEERVYLTGLSMGGYGTWNLATTSPHRFAAIAPICGGGLPRFTSRLRAMGIWVFHGAKDPVVKLNESEEMVEALKAAQIPVKFTVYPEATHDSWTETYNNPELYEWFLQHRRSRQ